MCHFVVSGKLYSYLFDIVGIISENAMRHKNEKMKESEEYCSIEGGYCIILMILQIDTFQGPFFVPL